jgi:hypothetical protein
MKATVCAFALLTAFGLAFTAAAQMPAGSAGECKDGTYSSAWSKRGACAGHGGVKDWYGEKKMEATMPGAAAPRAGMDHQQKDASKRSAESIGTLNTTAAAGGGTGKVWADTSSKVYHCETDKWYGKTNRGGYLSEEEAKAKGYHADHGKSCK